MDTNSLQNFSHEQSRNVGVPPKSWLVESILATIFCCLPFGIVGIINATKVEKAFYAGDIEGANNASKNAKKWTIIAAISGVVFYVITIVLYVLIIAAAIANGVDDF